METPTNDRPIRIRAEPLLADPNTCKFTVSEPVLAGSTRFFPDAASAKGSPLVERIFAVDGVASVIVSDEVVTVGKTDDAKWIDLMKPLGAVIRATLLSGEAPIAADGDGQDLPADVRLREQVQRVLDEGINPFVANHGGYIGITEVKDGVVYVMMSGGCQGCSSASVTLRQGVQAMIREECPEVKDVVDVTEHAAGESPYYR